MKLNKMKKLQAIVIASSAALALCACGSSATDVAKSTEMSNEQETASKSDVKQTEAVEKNTEKSSAAESATAKKNEENNFQQNFKEASYKELTDTLEEIDTDIWLGTAGSSLVSIKVATHLLNWGVGTTLTTDEIEQKTKEWLSDKSGSQVTEFTKKFGSVYESYKKLLGPDAKELLDEAGCQDAAYPWSDSPIDTIEAINKCL